MPFVLYELDSAISEFFENVTPTREECDDYAYNLFGLPVRPVKLQGVSSYTLMAGDYTIVQFREESSLLDLDKLQLARDLHTDVVCDCHFHGFIGKSSPNAIGGGLGVYAMSNLPGINYIYVRESLAQNYTTQRATVQSLARFFAQSWLHGRQEPYTKGSEAEDVASELHMLPDILPSRFEQHANRVQDILPMLRSGELLMALTHGDLNEMNILVDPAGGNITGIVDWAEARMRPFGYALYALEYSLGEMGPSGWRYFANTDALRNEFWALFSENIGGLSETMKKPIQLAYVAGLLIRHGTEWSPGGMIRPLSSTAPGYRYLDALLPPIDEL